MNIPELVTLLKQIPVSATELIIYPTNRDTLFFSLTEGALPPTGAAWGQARDVAPEVGKSRFKVRMEKVTT